MHIVAGGRDTKNFGRSHRMEITENESVRRFTRLHQVRMNRDFGICSDPDNTHGVTTADPEILQRYAEFSQKMRESFGNDSRATQLIETTRLLIEAERNVSRASRRIDQEWKTACGSRGLSQSVQDVLMAGNSLLERLKMDENCCQSKEAIISQIKSFQTAQSFCEENLSKLRQLVSLVSQQVDEMSRSEESTQTYRNLLEKEIDMRIFIENEFPTQKTELEKMQAKLKHDLEILSPQVARLEAIHEKFPNIHMMIEGIRDSEATLHQLRSELESRRSELGNLAKVETTLIDELHALRRRKNEYEVTLNMTEEEYREQEDKEVESQKSEITKLETQNKELELSLNRARDEVEGLHRKIISSYGESVLMKMQIDSRILCAKKNLC